MIPTNRSAGIPLVRYRWKGGFHATTYVGARFFWRGLVEIKYSSDGSAKIYIFRLLFILFLSINNFKKLSMT